MPGRCPSHVTLARQRASFLRNISRLCPNSGTVMLAARRSDCDTIHKVGGPETRLIVLTGQTPISRVWRSASDGPEDAGPQW